VTTAGKFFSAAIGKAFGDLGVKGRKKKSAAMLPRKTKAKIHGLFIDLGECASFFAKGEQLVSKSRLLRNFFTRRDGLFQSPDGDLRALDLVFADGGSAWDSNAPSS
jgi:hypothetical protein